MPILWPSLIVAKRPKYPEPQTGGVFDWLTVNKEFILKTDKWVTRYTFSKEFYDNYTEIVNKIIKP